ncbi:MAG: response regulator [Deltaproteobacteria bacterium]|nr:response regulator [Deltaproteobacteria bacterium]
MDKLINDVFAELADGDEDLRDLHGVLEEILPEASLALYGDNGAVVGASLPGLSAAMLDECRGRATETEICGSFRLAGAGWLHAIRLQDYKAVLVFTQEELTEDLAGNRHLAALYHNSIRLALLRCLHQEAIIENKQLSRRMEVVSSKHAQLLDDNHRQFLLIQEKEKEYAKKLESEIASQTKQLRDTNARLEAASRLKSEFLANMSHELRTPMNAIIGFSGLLLETPLTGEQKEFAETISKASSSLLVLINDILDLAKIEAGKLELDLHPFKVEGLVKSVEAMFRSQALAKENRLSYQFDPDLNASLIGDENRLRQILVNLVGNAMKFTSKGEVVIKASKAKEEEKTVSLLFAVSDTGIGIPADRQKAVFEKFTQADGSTTRKYGGTGLGLSITSQLVSLMDGRIELVSAPGMGSTFSFVISFAKAAGKEEGAPPVVHGAVMPVRADYGSDKALTNEQPSTSGADFKVLVVEDNLVNQRLATLLLKKAGYEVDVADDGLKGLLMLKEQRYDLVLMDVQMPNMDGHTATRKVRELEASAQKDEYASLAGRAAPLCIVGLTAHARKEDEQQCYDAGMNDFLTKPIIKDKLVSLIDRIRFPKI